MMVCPSSTSACTSANPSASLAASPSAPEGPAPTAIEAVVTESETSTTLTTTCHSVICTTMCSSPKNTDTSTTTSTYSVSHTKNEPISTSSSASASKSANANIMDSKTDAQEVEEASQLKKAPGGSVQMATSATTAAGTTTSCHKDDVKAKKIKTKKAQKLSREMQTYIHSMPRTTAYRAATYRPTLETFQRVSFADYIRGVILGVPVDGVEPEEPYYSGDDDDDDSSDDSTSTSTNTKSRLDRIKTEIRESVKKEEKINSYKGDDKTDKNDKENHDRKKNDTNTSTTDNTDESNKIVLSSMTTSKDTQNDQNKDDVIIPLQASSSIDSSKDSIVATEALPPISASPSKPSTVRSTRSSTRRMTTRSQTDSIPTPPSPEKENIYSKPYYSIRRHQEEQTQEQQKQNRQQLSQTQNHRKPQEQHQQQQHASSKQSTIDTTTTTTSKQGSKTTTNNNNTIQMLKPYLQLDSLKLSDGIAKITPPKGWWDHAGIGHDLTGRNEPWSKGTTLGDTIIPHPIKQCVYGIGGVYDFTMMELPPISVSDFRKDADEYRKNYVGSEVDEDTSETHMDLLARKFWKRLGPTMESSKYGADMEGSLFDDDDACGWNVDKLESCLKLLKADVGTFDLDAMEEEEVNRDFLKLPGVTSAYLYFGMWASVFCAHTEDMNLLSINYLHAGAPKYWYAISPEDSDRFESLMTSLFSHQSTNCKEFLRHKRSLVSPNILTKAGIEYTTHVQRAGDIMITYPGSYHFGFNTGFNVAESTNFAIPEWIPMGNEAKVCMCHPHSVRIDMTRFKSSLDQYDRDQINLVRRGRPKQSYSDWAKDYVKGEIRKRKRELRRNKRYIKNDADETNQVSKKIFSSSKSSRREVVEVMKLSQQLQNESSSKRRKTMSSKKKKKKLEVNDFRIALKVKKKSCFCTNKQTPVLCLLETEAGQQYFAGNVISTVEDHVRIHFAGTSKSDDIWMEIDSDQLFLDGGSHEKISS